MIETLTGIVVNELVECMKVRDDTGERQVEPCEAIQVLQDAQEDASIDLIYRRGYALSCFYDYLWFDEGGGR